MKLGVYFKVHENILVNCGDFTGDCSSIHVMILALIFSEDKEGLFEVMSDRFMKMEVIIFILLSLISSVFFSNVVAGFIFLLQLFFSY